MFRCLFAAALASRGRVLVIEPHVVSGEVPMSRATCIELTKREAWEAKLGRLSSGPYPKVFVPLWGGFCPVDLEGSCGTLFHTALRVRDSRSGCLCSGFHCCGCCSCDCSCFCVCSLVAWYACVSGDPRIITRPGLVCGRLVRCSHCWAASANAANAPWLEVVVWKVSDRATSGLSRQIWRLSANLARTEAHASCRPRRAATASASKTSARRRGSLPRATTGWPGQWQTAQPAPAALVGAVT